MTIDPTPTIPTEITGRVQFYSRPEPLSLQAHGNLGVKPLGAPYAFAAGASIVPLQVGEFGMACLTYPIIFAGEQKSPMAVMGLKSGENLFVHADGQFEDLSYIPGFIRRYPFVLAGDETQEQLVVCIDRDAPMVSEGGEIPLFENGQLTRYAQNAVQFCSDFENERRRSDTFVAPPEGAGPVRDEGCNLYADDARRITGPAGAARRLLRRIRGKAERAVRRGPARAPEHPCASPNPRSI